MSEVDVNKDYELKVLKMVINKYLDETIPVTDKSLKALEVNRDQVVWELTTRIYNQSGHKVELSTVKNVVDSRIRTIKSQLSIKAAEKERMAEKARQIAQEEARKADEKARQLVEEKARKAFEEARKAAIEEARLRDEITSVLKKFGGDESKSKIFIRVRKIISEYSGVDENEVNEKTSVFIWKWYKGGGWFSSTIPEEVWDFKPEEASSYHKVVSTEWGGESNAVDILMTLEEEFNIEISDSEFEDLIGQTLSEIVDCIAQKM